MLERLGRYSVERKLADGGMGAVYLGRSPGGVQVVLKVPHAQDKDAAAALADEARAGMRLRHPAIVETLDFFVDHGVSVLVVAFIDGSSLFDLRSKAGPLPAPAVAEMGAALADALHAIHSSTDESGKPLQMVHRDVSPNNVLVATDGQVRLIDLGIVRSSERTSKATMQGMVKGTLRYLAPEILQGGDHSASSDLWALGITLWEAALGRYALPGDEMTTVRCAMDGTLVKRLSSSPLDGALLDALGAMIAPADTRLRNARAASAVLQRLATRLGGGKTLLAHAARTTQAPHGSSDTLAATELTARAALAEPRAVTGVSEQDSVFTSTTGRAGLPTMQVPRAQPAGPRTGGAGDDPVTKPNPFQRAESAFRDDPRDDPLPRTDTLPEPARGASSPSAPSSEAPTIMMPAVQASFETAATIQMGAWQPPPPTGPGHAPPPPDVATAPTMVAMKRADVTPMQSQSSPHAIPPIPVGPPPPPMFPPSAPKPQVQKGHRPPTQGAPAPVATAAPPAPSSAPKGLSRPEREEQGPKASLFLPIVVIDDDGNDVE